MSADGKQRLSVAIVAMGGQGGGVLSDWLRATAEAGGWLAQTTSVPGVAQRTGATIYYLEIFKPADDTQALPVLALMPVSGDVDLVVAAEWLETGRAIMRGLVTPDRTTLVASTHRSYATAEKMVPGDGRADSEAVYSAATAAAKKLIAFDMLTVAEQHGSVISASLLGAIAASGALPFERQQFEAAITEGGVGVERSLAAFVAAFEQAGELTGSNIAPVNGDTGKIANALQFALRGPLGERVRTELPQAAWAVAGEGVRRCIDYLDGDYASEYLDRLKSVAELQQDPGLMTELSRWLALRMCYEDTFRVADLKTRTSRFAEIRREVQAQKKQVIHQTEYLHPRVEEIADSLPVAWGQRLLDSTRLRGWVDSLFGKGRKIRTSSATGFLVMSVLAGWSHRRRGSLRHQNETAWIDRWLTRIKNLAPGNPALAVGVVRLAALVKGYSDTQTRSQAVFNRLFNITDGLVDRKDGAQILDSLIQAALADASGKALNERIAAIGAHPEATVPTGSVSNASD
ncbi:MAG: indolepyruvate oxidoreductase subunit beta family protein [Burkholderiaceae bacterium]